MRLTEWDHFIGAVVADVRAASKSNPRALAPVAHNVFVLGAEFGMIGGNIADPAEADLPYLADVVAGGQVEHRPVEPVMMLADILEQ